MNGPLSVCMQVFLYCIYNNNDNIAQNVKEEGSIDKMKAKETEAKIPTTPSFTHSLTQSPVRSPASPLLTYLRENFHSLSISAAAAAASFFSFLFDSFVRSFVVLTKNQTTYGRKLKNHNSRFTMKYRYINVCMMGARAV